MKLTLSFVLAAALAGSFSVTSPAAAQQADQVTVPFTDPGRPGSLRVSTLNGTVTVRAANRRDVLIESRGGDRERDRRNNNDRSGGLRRLSMTTGFEAVEENNQMVITSHGNAEVDLLIHVPTRTNLKVSGINGGPISVDGVEGDIEVSNTNDSIALNNVSGSVVANSVNGDVKVSLTRVTAQKPMAFTSLNGNVDVTLPGSLKATFKLRSDMGDVYTDFDLQVKTETTTSQAPRRDNGRFRIEVNRAITGTLNGGGPEIELRTYNGDVYLRKGPQ